jgi:hypothetical protein
MYQESFWKLIVRPSNCIPFDANNMREEKTIDGRNLYGILPRYRLFGEEGLIFWFSRRISFSDGSATVEDAARTSAASM